jgi:ubiquitin C-terminal hydrolase
MSVSSSESLMNLFKGGKSADELLKSTEIIKKMIIGISNLDNKNPNSLAHRVFGNIVSHASKFFNMGQKNSKTGIQFNMENMNYIKK